MDIVNRLRMHDDERLYEDADLLMSEAADEIERLQRIIDSRPAINAGLPETYIQWSQGIYETDYAKAVGHDA